ncbi:MAG: hypothetical protein V4671_05395, partial [Armatimonadota bacterium]
DWAQLDAFEAEYKERLAMERKEVSRSPGSVSERGYSPYLELLAAVAAGQDVDWLYREAEKSRDDQTRRLFALRGKILSLREKLDILADGKTLLDIEIENADLPSPKPAKSGPRRIHFLADPVPQGHLYPVTFDEIKATLAELPPEHAATVHEIRLSNQKHTGSDGDWLDGEIRLHCLITEEGKRLMGRSESGMDVERFGGSFEYEGRKVYAVWPLPAYKTFILRRVLVHEVAHGVAELPGYAEKVRRAGSVEKFCEQYAENFYRPSGKSVRLGF